MVRCLQVKTELLQGRGGTKVLQQRRILHVGTVGVSAVIQCAQDTNVIDDNFNRRNVGITEERPTQRLCKVVQRATSVPADLDVTKVGLVAAQRITKSGEFLLVMSVGSVPLLLPERQSIGRHGRGNFRKEYICIYYQRGSVMTVNDEAAKICADANETDVTYIRGFAMWIYDLVLVELLSVIQ
jgi:hypothetical protein